MKPKITVITVCYNSERTIERTIKNVISQDYDNKEYVVIDGASTDGTVAVVQAYAKHIDTFITEKDRGISDAFNKGISHATGDLIVCINSDDYLLPEALTKVAAAYDEHTDIYSGNLLLWDEASDDKRLLKPSTAFPVPPYFCRTAHQGQFISRTLYQQLGGYDVRLRYAMDIDFMMRATQAHAAIRHIDIPIAVFKLGGATSESIFKKRQEYLYLVRKNGGTWLQAHAFYAFLVVTQVGKKLLRLTGIDWVRRLRYKKA